MAELRVGGLALVFGLKNDISLNGKCVSLLFMVDHMQRYKSPVSEKTWAHGGSDGSWVCAGEVATPCNREYGWAVFKRINLMPIGGDDFTHEDEGEKELVNG